MGINNVLVLPDSQSLARFMVRRWGRLCTQAIRQTGRFAVALSGGKTPLIFYQMLATRQDFEWPRTHIFLVDERFVPTSDEQSNFRTISEPLLEKVPLPGRNIHKIRTDLADTTTSARFYEQELIHFFRLTAVEIPQFDLIMLGIGADGHTASIFPGSPALSEKQHLVTFSLSPASPYERITLTLPVVNNARTIVFLVTGREKSQILRRVIEGNDMNLPASRVRSQRGKLLFLADADAACDLALPRIGKSFRTQ